MEEPYRLHGMERNGVNMLKKLKYIFILLAISAFSAPPNCPTSSGALNYSTATNAFSCNAVQNSGLANDATTVNGQSCVLGGSCSGNATITLSGDVSGSGSTAITTTIGANKVTLGDIAQSGANTMLGNWTGSTANVAANSMPSCSDSGGNHLNYVAGTGITCGTTSSKAGTVTSVTFTGDGTILSSTPSSAVTTSGTLTATLANQTANTVLGALT